jgi:hypothetical protein
MNSPQLRCDVERDQRRCGDDRVFKHDVIEPVFWERRVGLSALPKYARHARELERRHALSESTIAAPCYRAVAACSGSWLQGWHSTEEPRLY